MQTGPFNDCRISNDGVLWLVLMNRLPPNVEDRLKQLAARFREGLPAVMAELDSLRETAEEGDVSSLRTLRMRVHRVAGSAATFGFVGITRAAQRCESGIEADLAGDEQILGSTSAELLDELKRELRNPVVTEDADDTDATELEEVEPAPVQEAVAEPPIPSGGGERRGSRHRLIMMVGEIPDVADDVAQQLSVFGLTVVQAAEIGELESFMVDSSDTPDEGYDYIVLLSTVQYLSQQVSRLRDLRAFRDEYRGRFLTILVGDEDDFDTRLKSVRFGADAFLSLPFDTTQLVDQLETLLGDREADPYHILIVDDDPEQVSMTALQLQQAGMITSVVTDPRNIFRVLVEYKPELILLDMYMPDCSGAELAAIIRQNDNFVGIPIVFLSVEKNAAKQLEAIRSGADDFLTKPINTDHLITSVRIRASRTRAMRFFMERDSLTGLLNHTNLKQRLGDDLARARRIGTQMVFAMIDIDHFKSVNDTYGHLTGDRVLKGLARLLEERLRRTDVVGRYGGEEFGVILFNTDGATARELMDRLRESFSLLRQTAGQTEFSVTFSCGLAEFPVFDNLADVGEAADRALYRAKETGRNRVVIADRAILGG